jgi:hypothetical protein
MNWRERYSLPSAADDVVLLIQSAENARPEVDTLLCIPPRFQQNLEAHVNSYHMCTKEDA